MLAVRGILKATNLNRRSLKSDRSASGEARFSLTAHVTGARVGAADSPDPDAVAGRPRGRVDVIEESPIKAPG